MSDQWYDKLERRTKLRMWFKRIANSFLDVMWRFGESLRSTPQLRGACERSWASGFIWGVFLASMLWAAVLWFVVGVIGGGE